MLRAIQDPLVQWTVVGFSCIVLMAAALIYEYVFDALPCVMCVQVRLWLSAVFVLSIAGAALRHHRWAQAGLWVGSLASGVALIERSWQLLAIDKGWVIPECGIPSNPGLPAWLPLHDWLPVLFRPETTCGASPEMMFGITMTQGTLMFSVAFTAAAIAGLIIVALRRWSTALP